ncbi:hypothetical protein [Marinobacter alexandrii]|uniref:hypothetical protein n=1 Tax=Marinobacter alexandrii TaxID=2570351 RepID=UPI002ABE4973|nr:hypothetical protein [Marinobacter alexandrii]
MSIDAKQLAFGGFTVLVNRAIYALSGFLVEFQPLGCFNWLIGSLRARAIHCLDKACPIAFVRRMPGFLYYLNISVIQAS